MNLDEYTGASPAVEPRGAVSKIAGHLETVWGKIAVSYHDGKEKVVWKFNSITQGKAWGDITCVNRVGDVIIVGILVTEVKPAEADGSFIETGANVYFGLKDNGNPGNGQPNDQIAGALVKISSNDCSNPFVVGFLTGTGFSGATTGNIEVE